MNSGFTALLLLSAAFLFVTPFEILEISDKIVDASCLRTSYSAAIVRGYLSTGMVDPNLKSNMDILSAAKFDAIIYMNPCVKCGNATGQVDAVFAAIGDIMLRKPVAVYVFGDQWGKDKQANKKFLIELIKAIAHHTSSSLIMTNKYHWETIIGETIMDLLISPIVYINVDHKKTCDDYEPFACWNKPLAKKFESDTTVCGHKVGMLFQCSESSNLLSDIVTHADA